MASWKRPSKSTDARANMPTKEFHACWKTGDIYSQPWVRASHRHPVTISRVCAAAYYNKPYGAELAWKFDGGHERSGPFLHRGDGVCHHVACRDNTVTHNHATRQHHDNGHHRQSILYVVIRGFASDEPWPFRGHPSTPTRGRPSSPNMAVTEHLAT